MAIMKHLKTIASAMACIAGLAACGGVVPQTTSATAASPLARNAVKASVFAFKGSTSEIWSYGGSRYSPLAHSAKTGLTLLAAFGDYLYAATATTVNVYASPFSSANPKYALNLEGSVPNALAIDPSTGYLYVVLIVGTEPKTQNVIEAFPPGSATRKIKIKAYPDAENSAGSMAIRKGVIYFSSSNGNGSSTVYEYDTATGRQGRTFPNATAAAVDGSGNVYVNASDTTIDEYPPYPSISTAATKTFTSSRSSNGCTGSVFTMLAVQDSTLNALFPNPNSATCSGVARWSIPSGKQTGLILTSHPFGYGQPSMAVGSNAMLYVASYSGSGTKKNGWIGVYSAASSKPSETITNEVYQPSVIAAP